MPGVFSGISMAASALRYFQSALETTGHNIANVNTPGYSRQTVEFKTSVPLTLFSQGWKALGTGVTLSSIQRVRDLYLEQNSRDNQGSLGKYETLANALRKIEGTFQEPGENGIAAALDRFFDSWSALGSNPSDSAARVQVQSSGSLLAGKIRSTYGQLFDTKKQIQTDVQVTVDRINELGQQIDSLNKEIRAFTATQGSPNDLLDLRDAAVRELSGLVDTKVERFEDGSYTVYAGGMPLVDSTTTRQLPSTLDSSNSTFSAYGVTFNVRSGTLAGLLQASNETSAQMAQLDTLANELRTQFNAVHQTGVDLDGNTGNDFFNSVLTSTGAIDFDLSASIKASPRAIVAGASGVPGDGGVALAFSQLRDTGIAALSGRSFHDYYQTSLAQIGSQVSYYEAARMTEQAIADQIESQVQATSGVSLDDEMAEMMRFQRSYQAAAKALTVFDQVAEDLIGMLRR